MKHRGKRVRVLAATGAAALIVAGGVALAQPGDGWDAGPEQRIVRDQGTIELAWMDADGAMGTDTVALDLTDRPDQADSGPSPQSVDPPQDPMKS